MHGLLVHRVEVGPEELTDLLREHPVELVEFAAGEARRKAALESYAGARDRGELKMKGFADSASFFEAIERELQRWDASDRLTVFLQDSERQGVYEMTRGVLTEFAARLLSYDGNCVFFVSADDAHGLLLDAEQLAGVPVVFELESW